MPNRKTDFTVESAPSSSSADAPAAQRFPARLSFFDHLDEMRSRIIKGVLGYALSVIAVFQCNNFLLAIVMKPVGRVVFTSPEEAFTAQVNLALLAGFIITLPFTLYQIWQFVSLGLTRDEKKYIGIFGPCSLICFVAGVLFAYFVMIPMSLQFLLKFSSNFFVPMITVDKYISFFSSWILASGIVFELPLVLDFLAMGLEEHI